ncbi:MAG: hypothetical protein WBV94_01205 [Blastocatellia bacterium]
MQRPTRSVLTTSQAACGSYPTTSLTAAHIPRLTSFDVEEEASCATTSRPNH